MTVVRFDEPGVLFCPNCLRGPLLATDTPGRGYCAVCQEYAPIEPAEGPEVTVTNVDHARRAITVTVTDWDLPPMVSHTGKRRRIPVSMSERRRLLAQGWRDE